MPILYRDLLQCTYYKSEVARKNNTLIFPKDLKWYFLVQGIDFPDVHQKSRESMPSV